MNEEYMTFLQWLNIAIFWNVDGVTSQNTLNLYHHVISKPANRLCLSDLKFISFAEVKCGLGGSNIHVLRMQACL
jgi:hypothetical protein